LVFCITTLFFYRHSAKKLYVVLRVGAERADAMLSLVLAIARLIGIRMAAFCAYAARLASDMLLRLAVNQLTHKSERGKHGNPAG
jgi:hypothetical protein